MKAPASDGALSELLLLRRQEVNVSRNDLAKASGIDRTTLFRWETGKTLPRIPELNAVLDALNADAALRHDALERLRAPRGAKRLEEITWQEEAAGVVLPRPSDLLRALRGHAGFTPDEAAACSGMTRKQVLGWERGDVQPTSEQLHRYGFALSANPDEVVALASLAASRRESSSPDNDTRDTPELLSARLEWLNGWPRSQQKYAISDLAFHSLASASARLYRSRRRLGDLQFLAEVYAAYGEVLYIHARREEAKRYLLQSLRLYRYIDQQDGTKKIGAPSVSLSTSRLAQIARIERAGTEGATAGLDVMQTWLPHIRDEEHRMRQFRRVKEAKLLAEIGETRPALRIARTVLSELQALPATQIMAIYQQDAATLIALARDSPGSAAAIAFSDRNRFSDDLLRHPHIQLEQARAFLAFGKPEEALGNIDTADTWLRQFAEARSHVVPSYASFSARLRTRALQAMRRL